MEASAKQLEELLDDQDLRAVIGAALSENPVGEQALRRGVWTYVGMRRQAGTSPGHVIMQLTELVEAAELEPIGHRHDVMRRVMLWCVEAYFGHLGGDVVGQDDRALSDFPDMSPTETRRPAAVVDPSVPPRPE